MSLSKETVMTDPILDSTGRLIAPPQTLDPDPNCTQQPRPAGPWDANTGGVAQAITPGSDPRADYAAIVAATAKPVTVAIDEARIPQQVWDALAQLADVSTFRHADTQSDETFVECGVCGEWEGCKAGCPMPLVRALLG
jgi:hypothetical protein